MKQKRDKEMDKTKIKGAVVGGVIGTVMTGGLTMGPAAGVGIGYVGSKYALKCYRSEKKKFDKYAKAYRGKY